MSLDNASQMSRNTATVLLQMFEREYRLDDRGEFVNKVGRPAPQKTLNLVTEAQAVLADVA
jgi:hypothetical protein